MDLNPALDKRYVVTGVVLSFVLPVISLILPSVFFGIGVPTMVTVNNAFVCSRMFLWGSLLALYIYAIKIEKQNFLLYQPKQQSFIFYPLAIVILLTTLFLLEPLLVILLKKFGFDTSVSKALLLMLRIFKSHPGLGFYTFLTAGVMEELVFRGYLQSRLEILFKNSATAIIVSSVLFGLIHFGYGTLNNIAGPILVGIVFGIFYKKYGNIYILIITHFLYDLILITVSIHHYLPN